MLFELKTKFTRQNFQSKFRRAICFIKALPALAFLLFPFLVLAQSKVQQGLDDSGLASEFGNSGLLGATSVEELIETVIKLLLSVAFAIAVGFLIVGGYQYITSAGNEEQAEKGNKTLINAIIGVVIIVLSYVIVTVIVDLVSN